MRHRSRQVGRTAALFILSAATTVIASEKSLSSASVIHALPTQTIMFTENLGQWPAEVLFRSSCGGATIWYCRDKVVYQFIREISPDQDSVPDGVPKTMLGEARPVPLEELVVTARFEGCNPNVVVSGDQALDFKCNYFLGSDPAKWRANVPNYRSIVYEHLYPGLTLRLSEHNGFEYVTKTNGLFEQVKIVYEGIERLSRGQSGPAQFETSWGDFTGFIVTPSLTAVANSTRGEESTTSRAAGSQGALGSTLAYSSFLGGSDLEGGTGIAVDKSQCVYVTGYVASANFPLQTPYQLPQASFDMFVSKFSADGSSLVYSTYLGGNGNDWSEDIQVDSVGNVFIGGYTFSTDFPTVNPYQVDPSDAASDIVVTKLSAAGDNLLFSTYLGGSNNDYGNSIAVDNSGSVYVTGQTWSTNYPTVNPFQANQPDRDSYITKLSPDGSSLSYSSYLGGNNNDIGYGIAVDEMGYAYIAGYTLSTDFPTAVPFQADMGDADGFVCKVAANGATLVFSTYLGGANLDHCTDIDVDPIGNVCVTGRTASIDYPVLMPYQVDTDGAEFDAFVTKLSSIGNSLLFSTYLGGQGYDQANGIHVDPTGRIHITGWTLSTDFPAVSPIQMSQDTTDAFASSLSSDGNSVLFSTYIGGSGVDIGTDVAIDSTGMYIVGETNSADFLIQASFDGSFNGVRDVFITKVALSFCCSPGSTLRGDIAMPVDNTTDGSDLGVCVDYVFFNDESAITTCVEHRDVNNDASFDGGDLGILVDYIFFNDTGIITRCDGSPF